MDRQTTQYQLPRASRANPVLVLEVDDVELVEEPAAGARRGPLYPAAISDWELRQLVDECTSELCQLGAYRYGPYTR